ncbi:IS3 family transposase [Dactylosporangium sp. NPDC050688]|uniref:IS3 family transposase n=1 Tax=Dactylosporangium sp. NPDC050688 TaxID=3157217 RepID=UPI003406C5B4
MPAPKKYNDELRERATRLAVEARRDPASAVGAIRRIADQLGVHPEALRTWVKKAETDAGERPGTSSSDAERIAALERENRELRRANQILKSAAFFLRGRAGPAVAMRIDFVDSQKEQHGVQPVLQALQDTPAQIAPSTYYAAKTRPASARSRRDSELTEMIKRIHRENYGVYGARKIWHELRRRGVEVARCTVERLMRAAGLRGLLRDRSPRTTRPAPETGRPRDLVKRDFTAAGPNQLWVADLTYVRTSMGWVYAAFVLDVYARMIVGWQVSTSLYTDLALDALKMAIWRREHQGADLQGLVHHSDRGVQYRAIRYSQRLAEAGVVASVGAKGDSYDNAMAEAFNSLYKAELVRNRGPWRGLDDLEMATVEYIDWYNNRRLHGELGHLPPAEYEALHTMTQPVTVSPKTS